MHMRTTLIIDQNLFEHARQLTGIRKKTALVRAGLEALIARDATRAPHHPARPIELKVSRGHEKTAGQALYYRARIKQRFGAERVRIFIVAAEISPTLQAAASEVSDVLLFEYSLAVKVTAITT